MVQKNVKMLMLAIVLLVAAGTMLVVTIRGSGGGPDLPPGKEILDPDDVPDIAAPGGHVPEPYKQEDNRGS